MVQVWFELFSCNFRIWEVEKGRLEIQGHSRLQRECKDKLGYMRPSLKATTIKANAKTKEPRPAKKKKTSINFHISRNHRIQKFLVSIVLQILKLRHFNHNLTLTYHPQWCQCLTMEVCFYCMCVAHVL